MPRRIDAHHHLWRYTAEEYDWIDDAMQELRRDYTPGDLAEVMALTKIDGSITVQARQNFTETYDLISLAEKYPFIEAVVGWAPIASREFPACLERLIAQPKLKGLRHVIQAEDDDFILGSDFNRGITTMLSSGLVYEILIYERHLPQTIKFVDSHPDQIFVLDHIAKPRIRDRILSPWRENIYELAKRDNVFCKVSGMTTEADWHTWSEADLRPYLDTVFDAFGAARLMMGSDWPVCLLAVEYSRWFGLLDRYSAELSLHEREEFCGGTAIRIYNLDGGKKSSQRR